MEDQSTSSIQTQSQYTPYVESQNMKRLHKEFKAVTEGHSNPNRFHKMAEDMGYNPTSRIQKVLNDPEPKFKNIVKNLGKFQKPTQKERIGSKYAGMYGRYPKRKQAEVGTCKDEKLGALQNFQRGNITEGQLKNRLGGSSLRALKKDLARFEDGDFRKVGTKIMRNERLRAERLNGPQNTDPVILNERKNFVPQTFGKKIVDF